MSLIRKIRLDDQKVKLKNQIQSQIKENGSTRDLPLILSILLLLFLNQSVLASQQVDFHNCFWATPFLS